MRQRSKRYRAWGDISGLKQPRPIAEATELVKKHASAKFTESVDVAIRLNIDTRKADQQVRGSFSLPNGTGRNNAGFGFVRSGNRSMEISRGFSTFTAAIYQTVTVPENSNVRGSAHIVMNIAGDNANSASSTARVGIDPTGDEARVGDLLAVGGAFERVERGGRGEELHVGRRQEVLVGVAAVEHLAGAQVHHKGLRAAVRSLDRVP